MLGEIAPIVSAWIEMKFVSNIFHIKELVESLCPTSKPN